MEQLIIFLLFVAASIISSIVQKKKKAEEEAAARGELPPPPRPPASPAGPSPSPVTRWPRSAQEWQEQLRRIVEETAPPVIKPLIVPEKRETVPPPTRPPAVGTHPPEKPQVVSDMASPLRESASAYARAAELHAKVEERLRPVEQAVSHRAGTRRLKTPPVRANAVVRNLRRRPNALREAFVASLIFSAPKSLETGGSENYR